jgi:hypothetical protein
MGEGGIRCAFEELSEGLQAMAETRRRAGSYADVSSEREGIGLIGDGGAGAPGGDRERRIECQDQAPGGLLPIHPGFQDEVGGRFCGGLFKERGRLDG